MLSTYHYEQRLLKLADFLSKLKPVLFDFSHVLHVGAKMPNAAYEAGGGCGTTACAVGWAPKIWPQHLKWAHSRDDGIFDEGFKPSAVCLIGHEPDATAYAWATSSATAAKFFGLSDWDVKFLFEPYRSRLGEGATPKRVARHIQKFVAKQRKARGYTGQ